MITVQQITPLEERREGRSWVTFAHGGETTPEFTMPAKKYAPKKDLPSPAQIITDTIIARLEQGVPPWRKPWTGTTPSPPTRACGERYRGINHFWLGLIADMSGYTSPFWMTYRQATELGGQVRKGERSTIAIFYKAYSASSTDERTGDERTDVRRVLKSYPVFNADQVDGLPRRFHPVPEPITPAAENPARLAELQAFFDAIPATVRHGGAEAYYTPVGDYIQMPLIDRFTSYEGWCATIGHEFAHWTGAEHRLNRNLGSRFGTNAYAAEEGIAELTAAMLGAELGIPSEHLDDHAAYIGGWLRIMKADSRAILTFAAKADEATEYLLRLAGRTRGDRTTQEQETEDAG